MKCCADSKIVPASMLIHDNFFTPVGDILPGTYIIMAATYRTARNLIDRFRQLFQEEHKLVKWNRGESKIVCGEITIFIFTDPDPTKLAGITNIKGYMIESGIRNPVEIGDYLKARISSNELKS